MKIIKRHVSLNVKIIQIHCRTSVFVGSASCVREWKRYPTTVTIAIKIHSKIDGKSMQINTRKSNATNIVNQRKLTENGGPNHEQSINKGVTKIEETKRRNRNSGRGGPIAQLTLKESSGTLQEN